MSYSCSLVTTKSSRSDIRLNIGDIRLVHCVRQAYPAVAERDRSEAKTEKRDSIAAPYDGNNAPHQKRPHRQSMQKVYGKFKLYEKK